MFNSYTEDQLVEQPAIQLILHEQGWEVGVDIELLTSSIGRSILNFEGVGVRGWHAAGHSTCS